MQAQTTNKLPFLVISTIILVAGCLLGLMDSDTKGFADLFVLENILGLAVYFVPTMLVCALLYRRYKRKDSMAVSVAKAVTFGIPLVFVSIIVLAIALKNAGVV